MYAEVLYDESGNIKACYCADTLPEEPGAPAFRYIGAAEGLRHARLNMDTLTAMEVEAGSVPRAELDETGKPVVVRVDRAKYITANFAVDLDAEFARDGVILKGLRRKG